MKTLKRFLPDLLVVLLFAVIAFAYFFPADTEGRILYRHDSSAGRGAGEELTEYYQRTGECGGTAERVAVGVCVGKDFVIVVSLKKAGYLIQIHHFLPHSAQRQGRLRYG